MSHQATTQPEGMRDMFDFSLAHIVSQERDRDLSADLHVRRMLAATTEETAVEPVSVRRPVRPRATQTRARAIGR